MWAGFGARREAGEDDGRIEMMIYDTYKNGTQRVAQVSVEGTLM